MRAEAGLTIQDRIENGLGEAPVPTASSALVAVPAQQPEEERKQSEQQAIPATVTQDLQEFLNREPTGTGDNNRSTDGGPMNPREGQQLMQSILQVGGMFNR